MPYYKFTCEICGEMGRAWRREDQGPPRFCSRICKAKGLSLSVSGKSLKPSKYQITSLAHEQIKKAYEGETGNGQIRDLARRLNLPRWKITKHAIKHGWIAVQKKEPPWSERELGILERSAHLTAVVIKRHLKAVGFHRTEMGIVLKRKRMRFLQNLHGQSATSLALCFGVDAKTVTRWLEKGYLQARKRGTARLPQQGGDMWFIKDADIKEFIITYPEFVDLRKIDKEWFISLLTDGQMPKIRGVEGRGYEAAQY